MFTEPSVLKSDGSDVEKLDDMEVENVELGSDIADMLDGDV